MMNTDEEGLIQVLASNRFINNQRLFLSLIVGFIVGLSFGYFLVVTSDPSYQRFLYRNFRKSLLKENEITSYYDQQYVIDHIHSGENSTLAQNLYDKEKILCFVATQADNHETRAIHIKQTWGRRCNKLLFISTKNDSILDAITFESKKGQENTLLFRTQSALKYIYNNYLNEYDWFLKADDESYMVMENLRYMLSPHSSDVPLYFGSKCQTSDSIYMQGGAGYVISRETLKRFIEIGIFESSKQDRLCNLNSAGYEDVELGKCFQLIDVIPGDLRDSESRTTFHQLGIEDHLLLSNMGSTDWFFKIIYYKTGLGVEFSSDHAISFHYVAPSMMYTMEFLIYHLKPYGIYTIPTNLITTKYTIDDELRILDENEKDRNEFKA